MPAAGYHGPAVAKPIPIPETTPEEAKRALDAGKALFVDIRDPDSYRSGHIPKALNLTDANVQEFLAAPDKTRPVIVCCYHGNSSRGATAFLLQSGFADVKSLSGGFEGWRARYPEAMEGSSRAEGR